MPSRLDYISRKFGRKTTLKAIKYPEIEPSTDDIYIITTVGDRLDLLAYDFYHNTDLWWIITSANPDIIRRDGFVLKPGLEIRIPSDYYGVLKLFEDLNK